MTIYYRLVFSGRLLTGQHVAVVQKRLVKVLKLNDEQVSRLFSGQPVVIKRAVDMQQAQRYLSLFERAGAELEVLPARPSDVQALTAKQPKTPPFSDLQLLPLGADVLTPRERSQPVLIDVDVGHLTVQDLAVQDQGAVVQESEVNWPGPSVDHITLAPPGAPLSQVRPIVEAAAGINAAVPRASFVLAEPGAEMSMKTAAPVPPAPETGHLQLQEN